MKKILLLIALLPLFTFGQQVHKQIVTSSIDEVKLYLTAGQMTHNKEIELKQGRNKLVFSGISAYANPQSIQFRGDGSYRMVSVSTEMDFLAAESFNPEISLLKDSLEFLIDQMQFTKDQIGSYEAEKGLMNTNLDLGGNSENLTVAEIKEAGTYYRTRTLEINRELSKLRKTETAYSTKIDLIRYQLVELNYDENLRGNQVIVLIDSDVKRTMKTSISYLVSDCGWAATYDLSAMDLTGKINLKYKAQVYNNTGNDWKDVKLTLSTADPQLSASHPSLAPWYVTEGMIFSGGFKVGANQIIVPQQSQGDYRQQAVSSLNLANGRAWDNYFDAGVVQNSFNPQGYFNDNKFQLQQRMNVGAQSVQMREIAITELSTEFEIENKFTCPSDMKPYMVDVKEVELDATFSHISVPKLDRSAFLMANIIGWQDLELIPGPTNVYFGGVYVGVSEIDTRNVSDTLSLSFGRDDKVIVMRKLKKEFSSKKIAGNFKKESYMYEIAVRNNRSVPIDIRVYDQIPISQSSSITVTTDEYSAGKKDDLTGEVEWRLNIAPGAVIGKELGYTVKYPKDMVVTIQRFRTVSCPSF